MSPVQFAAVLAQSSSESSLNVSPTAAVIGLIVGGGVGFAIGSSKNRPVLGLLLGAGLGCIGWLIVALIPKKDLYR
jgi:hypothetical protein